MPFVGFGLHVIVALFFAVHAVRTGQGLYWLIILFMFPLLGSVVYLFAVYLPDTRIQYTVRKSANAVARTLDPGRDLREAQRAYELTQTSQNRMRLAEALLETGQAAEAAGHFEACLRGPFASDPELRLGAARAWLECGRSPAAIEQLESLRRDDPDYYPEQTAVLLARAYAMVGRNDEAQSTFLHAVRRYGSLETRAEYAIWAAGVGDVNAAREQYDEIAASMRHFTKHARAVNGPLISRLEAAIAQAQRS